jgi:pyruvate-ferredoxin/flavodoxin oxidoreductase
VRRDGRGPTWSNSLFEDAAEFGMGMRLTGDKLMEYGRELLDRFEKENKFDKELLKSLKDNPQSDQAEIEQQREWTGKLKGILKKDGSSEAKELHSVLDYLVKRSVWILGGDGWAYDIGYGGLDHVIASGKNVNILCLDTEVYSNTGGQMSKSTPIGAIAKFAAGGKPIGKKDLGWMAMGYGYVYVARIAMGANMTQTIRAFVEAESYDGPSLIIAYSHCIAHGINMTKGLEQQKLAVDSGIWPLYRYDPRLEDEGKNPLSLDSKEPTVDVKDYMYNEIRFRSLRQLNPEAAEIYLEQARKSAVQRYKKYKYQAERPF